MFLFLFCNLISIIKRTLLNEVPADVPAVIIVYFTLLNLTVFTFPASLIIFQEPLWVHCSRVVAGIFMGRSSQIVKNMHNKIRNCKQMKKVLNVHQYDLIICQIM
jgi:hypothetical protein